MKRKGMIEQQKKKQQLITLFIKNRFWALIKIENKLQPFQWASINYI